MIHWIDFVFCVADAEGPKKGGKPPRPGLHPDIPTSNAGEEVVGCVKKIYPWKCIPYGNIIWIVPCRICHSFRSPRKAVSLEESGPSSTWHGTFLREIWWCFGRPNPHIHLSLDSLWIAGNQSKSCYLCSGASRGTWFCSLFDSFIWSSRQVDQQALQGLTKPSWSIGRTSSVVLRFGVLLCAFGMPLRLWSSQMMFYFAGILRAT